MAGIGDPRSDIGNVRDSWLEARLAARVATAVPPHGRSPAGPTSGFIGCSPRYPASELSKLLLDAPVRNLLDAPDPTLADTVKAFLDRAGNVQDTATTPAHPSPDAVRQARQGRAAHRAQPR